ncbi:MAG: glycosylase/AP lyase, DNA-binding protein [Cyanobacteria bacterium RYN_339]|nr:glycosylase/AP lyase, DNA-binding protein [Cyanobacteria bacterium RYN_339]
MSEGPEVRRKAEKLRELLVGEPLTEVAFVFDRLKAFEPELTGRRVTAVDTFGKAYVVRLEGGLNLYVHPKMFGHWILRVRPGMPKTDRALRIALKNRKGAAYLYSTNDMAVLTDEEVARHKYLTQLGPDILDPEVTEAQVLARYQDPRFAPKRLTTLLLDQGFLAGIGNYMRSEILFEARLYPLRRACDLSPDELARLAQATVAVSRRAFEARGMTVTPAIVAEGKRLKLKPWDYRHWVFKREAKPCYACGAAIERHETEGRRYFMCPVCQPAEKLSITLAEPLRTRASGPSV